MMRDLAMVAMMLAIVPMALVQPFVGVLLWSWVSFMNPHQLGWSFASSLPLAQLAFAVTVAGCVLAREPRRLPLNAVTILLVLLLGCVTFTSFIALGPPQSVWEKWDKVMKIILGLLLTAALLTERRRIHALVWLMVIALGYFGVKGGLFTLVTGGGFIVSGPPNSIISDRNQLAVALLVALPLMNYLRLHSAHRVVRIGLVIGMMLMLFSIVGTQSRGALVGLLATGFIMWLRSRGKLLSGVALAIGLIAAISFMPQSWVERMRTIETYQEDSSAVGRLEIWKAAFAIARERPLTGGGFRAVYEQDIVDRYTPGVRARADHSIWLEVMSEHGFPTFVVWLAIIGAGVLYSMRITRLARDHPDLRWAYDLAHMSQVAVVAYCTGGSFLSMAYWDFFWTLMVVIAATHALVLHTIRQEAAEAAAARWSSGERRTATAGVTAESALAGSRRRAAATGSAQ